MHVTAARIPRTLPFTPFVSAESGIGETRRFSENSIDTGLIVENNRTLPYGEEWLLPIKSANEQKFTSFLRDEEAGMDSDITIFWTFAKRPGRN